MSFRLSCSPLALALCLFLRSTFGVFVVVRQGWFVPLHNIVAILTASRGDTVISIIVPIVVGGDGMVVASGGIREQGVVESGHCHTTHQIVVVVVVDIVVVIG